MSRRTKPDRLLQLLSSFKAVAPGWRTMNIGFERRQVLTVDSMRWIVNYKIHALHDYPYKPSLQSSITLWPSVRDGRVRRAPNGWLPRPLDQKSRRSYERELARHGYHGKWQPSPVGTFGDFWKNQATPEALIAELNRLDRMQFQTTADHSVSFGDPTLTSGRRTTAMRRRTGGDDDLFHLFSSFGDLESEWSTTSFTLGRHELVTIDRTRWTVYKTIHVHGPRKLWLGSFLHLWPSRRAVLTRQGWHPRLLKQKWYQTCTHELARHGYKGEWMLSSVRHGQFLKKLRDPKAAATELKRLDRIQL